MGIRWGAMIKNRKTLILNADFTPLSIIGWQRAMVVSMDGGCFVLELARTYEGEPILVHSVRAIWPMPSVMMNPSYVNRGGHIRYSRWGVLNRDGYACMYCGTDEGEMTVDHIRPRVEVAGQESNLWTNRVCCCKNCNSQKGSRSLDVMRHERTHNGRLFRLIREPFEPTWTSSNRFIKLVTRDCLEWLSYIPDWEKAARRLGRNWLIGAHKEWTELHDKGQANLDLISSSTAAIPPDD